MASLAGALTFLALSAVSGPQTWTNIASSPGSRPNDGTFTQFSLMATPGDRYGSFTDKNVETSLQKAVTDTYRFVLTEGPASDTINIETTDTYRITLGQSAYAGLARTVIDTYTVVMGQVISSLSKSGTILKGVADTYTIALAQSPAVRVQQGVSDTYTLVLTHGKTLDSSDAKTVSDSYALVLTETSLTDAVIGNVNWPRADSYVLRMGMAATAHAAGDVDIIDLTVAPKGRIKITLV